VWAQQPPQDAQQLAACPREPQDVPGRAVPQAAMQDGVVLPPVPQAQSRVLLEQPALLPQEL